MIAQICATLETRSARNGIGAVTEDNIVPVSRTVRARNTSIRSMGVSSSSSRSSGRSDSHTTLMELPLVCHPKKSTATITAPTSIKLSNEHTMPLPSTPSEGIVSEAPPPLLIVKPAVAIPVLVQSASPDSTSPMDETTFRIGATNGRRFAVERIDCSQSKFRQMNSSSETFLRLEEGERSLLQCSSFRVVSYDFKTVTFSFSTKSPMYRREQVFSLMMMMLSSEDQHQFEHMTIPSKSVFSQ